MGAEKSCNTALLPSTNFRSWIGSCCVQLGFVVQLLLSLDLSLLLPAIFGTCLSLDWLVQYSERLLSRLFSFFFGHTLQCTQSSNWGRLLFASVMSQTTQVDIKTQRITFWIQCRRIGFWMVDVSFCSGNEYIPAPWPYRWCQKQAALVPGPTYSPLCLLFATVKSKI